MKMIKEKLVLIPAGGGERFGNPQLLTACMRKTLLTIGLGLALSGVTTFSSPAADAGRMMLRGHVPAIISGLQPQGRLPATASLDLAIGLPLRNAEALTNLLREIYDPASPNFHHYLTPEQFTAQFGPTEQDYQAVIDFAKANGLTVKAMHPNRVVLDVSGKAADVERALHVALRTYKHPTEARDFFAPDVEPSVPSGLPVQDVGGLDNYRRPHPKYKFKMAGSNAVPRATTGSGPAGDYIGNDFRNAYVPGTSLNGSGQTIALVQFDGYYNSDIAAYENLAGRTNIPLQNVLIDGFDGIPTGNGGEVEVSLDIEMSISMAPALAQVIVYEGNPFNFHPNNVLNRIATDNSARQISCSWGWSGGPNLTTDRIFQQMALQGQTFFDAVGDSDAFTSGANSVNGVDNPNLPNEPSSNPYITQVGGTTLTMNGAGASYASETVWNRDIRYGPQADGIGSSGGISSFYSIPGWQTNINMTIPQGSTTFRNVPDVALTADDVLVIADDGSYYTGVGGTSCAAPLWAGFTALANQQATNNASSPMGFINPALYAIAASANYTSCFHDITTGNNFWSASLALFSAVSGYDLCTGLGTPSGTNLINALTAVGSGVNPITHVSPPPPPYGTNLAALNGGNPNGTWELFVQDDMPEDSGTNYNGWILTLTTASPVGQSANLVLSMSASVVSNVLIGTDFNYFIGVINYGPSTANNVLVSDTLPSGVTLTNPPPGIIRSGSTVTWNVGTLASGASTNLTLTVNPYSLGTIVNYAIASADTPDPNPADNSTYVTLDVISSGLPPQFGNIMVSNGKFILSITNPPVSTIIQASTNLVSPNWVNVFTGTPPSCTFTDMQMSNFPYRFYRAVRP
jgi:uncharacterized repeat protein (TIGR01451 family)